MGDTSTSIFAFHPFRLDAAQRSLTRDGHPVALTPKEFDTLLVLVEAGGKIVIKEELLARVWPDSYVGDGSLARNISVLRKALGDEVIETNRGRGYRITRSVVLTDSFSVPAAIAPAETETSVPGPGETRVRTGWWTRKLWPAFATLGIVLIALAVIGYFGTKSAKARTSANATPIHSILIQKEGALDPLDEGFKLHLPDKGQYPRAVYNRETFGWDRWRIMTDDQNYYYRTLTAEEKDFALQRDWTLTCVCALEKGGGFANIDFAGKGPRFDIELVQEGNRFFVELEKQISPVEQADEKIEFPGVADVAHPHTYELRYDHVSEAASLWIDGKMMASGYRGHRQFQEDRGLLFGVAIQGTVDKSSAVFGQVRFEAK
jgi:DNA-binding winged helix-turn-helix (wHTH) protein